MYAARIRKPTMFPYFPGRIFFIQQLWGCIQAYLLVEEDWVKVKEDWVKVKEDTWGHYDEELNEWTQL